MEYARGISNYYIFLNAHNFFWLFLTSFWTIKIILQCNIYFLFSVMFSLHKCILKITEGKKDLINVHNVLFHWNEWHIILLNTRLRVCIYCLLLIFPFFFTQLDSLFSFFVKPNYLIVVFHVGKLSFHLTPRKWNILLTFVKSGYSGNTQMVVTTHPSIHPSI